MQELQFIFDKCSIEVFSGKEKFSNHRKKINLIILIHKIIHFLINKSDHNGNILLKLKENSC